MKTILMLLLIILFACSGSTRAQEFIFFDDIAGSDYLRYGIFIGLTGDRHEPEFSKLQGVVSCCPQPYAHESSLGFNVSAFYQRALFRRVTIAARLTWSDFSIVLNQDEPTTVSWLDTSSNLYVPVEAAFRHSIDAGLGSLGLEILLGYRVIHEFAIYAGLQFSLFLRQHITYEERLIVPDSVGIEFVDGERGDRKIRNRFDGDIPTASSNLFNVSIGAGYEFALNSNHTLFLEPQVLYSFGLNSLIEEQQWDINALRFGIAFKYSPFGIPPLPVESPKDNEPIFPDLDELDK